MYTVYIYIYHSITLDITKFGKQTNFGGTPHILTHPVISPNVGTAAGNPVPLGNLIKFWCTCIYIYIYVYILVLLL